MRRLSICFPWGAYVVVFSVPKAGPFSFALALHGRSAGRRDEAQALHVTIKGSAHFITLFVVGGGRWRGKGTSVGETRKESK
jgi:hypothetical protein